MDVETNSFESGFFVAESELLSGYTAARSGSVAVKSRLPSILYKLEILIDILLSHSRSSEINGLSKVYWVKI
jgi:hypothetical protein